MTDQQKKNYKNHHKVRTILLNFVSYTKYEKITNKDTAESIFDSLRVTHEGNTQVKETKVFALIKKMKHLRWRMKKLWRTCFQCFRLLLQDLRFWTKGILLLIMLKRSSKVYLALETYGNNYEVIKGAEHHFS